MNILVDADACPVIDIIEKIAREFSIPVRLYIDTSHILHSDYSKIIQVSKAPDAVDLALINQMEKGDIVVTQDYGVASLVLGKHGYAMNQNGRQYTEANIDRLMFERHLSRQQRKAGKRTGSLKKRTNEDNIRFESAFRRLIAALYKEA